MRRRYREIIPTMDKDRVREGGTETMSFVGICILYIPTRRNSQTKARLSETRFRRLIKLKTDWFHRLASSSPTTDAPIFYPIFLSAINTYFNSFKVLKFVSMRYQIDDGEKKKNVRNIIRLRAIETDYSCGIYTRTQEQRTNQ